jgi:HEPN domain-containing protein
MATLKSLAAGALRADAFSLIQKAEKEYATAETFIRANDWESAATKLRQTAQALTQAANAFDAVAARSLEHQQ